jgi:hypothetical protein
MANLYTVTAENNHFYVELAVIADSREDAETLFDGFMPTLGDAEKYEIQNARAVADADEEVSESDFSYGFDPDDIEEDETEEDEDGEYGSVTRYTGRIGREVVAVRSGANG